MNRLGTDACSLRSRPSFTLVELLITMSIIAILAGTVLLALAGAEESAKSQKTRALIVRLDSIIRNKYETYRTRRIPLAITSPKSGSGVNVRDVARARRLAMNDLMRMEMPDRWKDITEDPIDLSRAPYNVSCLSGPSRLPRPSASTAYKRKHDAGTPPTNQFEDAECLYLIVTGALADEGDGVDAFRPDQSADTDGDGFKEFIDGWRRPISFIRWPSGFPSDLNVLPSTGTPDATTGADYDTNTVVLIPLVYSSGPDKTQGIAVMAAGDAVTLNPFALDSDMKMYGRYKDDPAEPFYVSKGWLDNIHNHVLDLR